MNLDVLPPEHPGALRTLFTDVTAVLTRTISHLKIVDQPGRPAEVKGYLGMYRTKTPLTLINVNTPG